MQTTSIASRHLLAALLCVVLVVGCKPVEREFTGWGCSTDADCVTGFACETLSGVCVSSSCPDLDADGVLDCVDTCVDVDGDGLGNGALDNAGCIASNLDSDDTDPFSCANVDFDACDDCAGGVFNPAHDGSNGLECGVIVLDADGDTVPDSSDTAPGDRYLCRDLDGDGCDDCAVTGGPPDMGNDGTDYDQDGICDASDTCFDKDKDGFGTVGHTSGCTYPTADNNDLLAVLCRDNDLDGCDDCSGGLGPNIYNDGPDADADGLCDIGDTCTDADLDGIGRGTNDNVGCVLSGEDLDDSMRTICMDLDLDGCDDCAITAGPPAPDNDGIDVDMDGMCDAYDTCVDFDGDGVGTGANGNVGCPGGTVVDVNDRNTSRCGSGDGDLCDDCASGSFNPEQDGPGGADCPNDTTDTDNDGVPDVIDEADNDNTRCLDSDDDGCDDCAVVRNPPNPLNDGADYDLDGVCDFASTCSTYSDCGQRDTCFDKDGDGFGTAGHNSGCVYATVDTNDNSGLACRDQDNDSCDDCSQGSGPNPNNDGVDYDGDGKCDAGDTCFDKDGDGFGTSGHTSGCQYTTADSNDNSTLACRDQDNDGCDDCSQGTGPNPSNDGAEYDLDGICDVGDMCFDKDNDKVGTGAKGNAGCLTLATDSNDQNAQVCASTDGDTCDDCTLGSFAPTQDGPSGSECPAGTIDADGDSVPEGADSDDNNHAVCRDLDADTCDDCSVTFGPPSTSNDGRDSNGDGICDRFSWYNLSWTKRRTLATSPAQMVKSATASFSNFPVLVALTSDASLANSARDDGNDLVFTSSDGKTLLAWEIDSWDPNTGTLRVWVRLPAMSTSTATTFYLYYGNPNASSNQQNATGVWDADFLGVWHLSQNPNPAGGVTSAIKDSTSNAHHGTPNGSMASSQLKAGRIGSSLQFDGTNDFIDVGNPAALANLQNLTFEAWVCQTGAPSEARVIAKEASCSAGGARLALPITSTEHCSSPGERCLYFYRDRANTDTEGRGAPNTLPAPASTCTWVHVAAAFVTSPPSGQPQVRLWVNGATSTATLAEGSSAFVSDSSYPLTLGSNTCSAQSGHDPTRVRALAGSLDEVRVSRVSRTGDWVGTSYNNQNSPSTFLTIGSAEDVP